MRRPATSIVFVTGKIDTTTKLEQRMLNEAITFCPRRQFLQYIRSTIVIAHCFFKRLQFWNTINPTGFRLHE